MPASPAMTLFGTEQTDPEPHRLQAGALTALFDNGALRRICHDGTEVVRGIAYLPRDRNWGTYPPLIEDLKVIQGPDGFSITYAARFRDADQSLSAEARIDATADGTLRFSVTATPGTDFTTNRTGFVILHPLAGVVGKPVEVLHTDGSKEQARFPALISPGQPIFEISGLTHRVAAGVTATLRMEGNKFEMEDHRNWMDASYKTYVCSLLDPWPYTLPKGEPFTQTVSLSITGKKRKASARPTGSAVRVTLGKPGGRLPSLGTGIAMAEAPPALAAVDPVRAAGLAHLVCQIDGRRPGQAETAALYRQIKAQTGIPVTLEIILPAQGPATGELGEIAGHLTAGGLVPDAVIVTQMHDLKSFQPGTPRPWGPTYADMAGAARAHFPGVPIGGGMLSFFTELNRKPPPPGLFDFITHSTCPIVHAADDLSVMETLEAVPWIVKSTRALIGRAKYHLGPSSLACRDNPYGAACFPNPGNARLCLTDRDPRQFGLFGAAWSLGLVTAMARGRLEAVALGSATGPRGVVLDDGQMVAPAYHVLAGLARAGRARMIGSRSDAPAGLATLAHQTETGWALWLANLTGAATEVDLSHLGGPLSAQVLDADSFEAARSAAFMAGRGRLLSRLVLQAYAVARIASG